MKSNPFGSRNNGAEIKGKWYPNPTVSAHFEQRATKKERRLVRKLKRSRG